MAKVTQRFWEGGPRKASRCAWGYTAQIDGKQMREFHEHWSKEDAEKALAARLLGVAPQGEPTKATGMTCGIMVQSSWPPSGVRASGRSRTTRSAAGRY
jgi:hypothetical protein